MQYLPSWLVSMLWPIGEWLLVQILKFFELKYPEIRKVVDKVIDILSSANPPSASALAEHLDARFMK